MAHFAAVFSFSFLECRNEAVGEVIVDILADVVALEDLDELLVGRVVAAKLVPVKAPESTV